MIISYQHRFIFVKTKKTAGSSIENYLFGYLGPKDICTGSDWDGTPALNAIDTKRPHARWDWIAENYPQEWQDFFSFAVIRNPWDVTVSAYFWFRAHSEHTGIPKEKYGSFNEWVQRYNLSSLDPWPIIAQEDSPMVNRVLRYENLHSELSTIPIPYQGEMLTTFKKSGCREGQGYREFFDDQSQEKVASCFDRMIKYFGYEF